MCGRYVLKRKDLEAALRRLGVADVREFASRYNIAPTTNVPAIRRGRDGALEAVGLQWGLVPAWAKDAREGARLSNARADGVATKAAFRDPFRRRRCVVPASGFYEWQTIGKAKYPWYFSSRDNEPLLLAGLWETWRSVDGVELQTCALITTEPNDIVRPLHDRMPVILRAEAATAWLDPAMGEPPALQPLLAPLPAELMSATPVSPRVNNVRYDAADCLEPVAPPVASSAPAPADEQLGFAF
jgi:putative SOS response-associated peptidase YedK